MHASRIHERWSFDGANGTYNTGIYIRNPANYIRLDNDNGAIDYLVATSDLNVLDERAGASGGSAVVTSPHRRAAARQQ